jgi:hypothetical protein
VACLRIAPDEVWVMAVLQREEGAANVVRCPGNLRIAVDGGALELAAARVGLRSDALDIDARQLRVNADTAESSAGSSAWSAPASSSWARCCRR